MSVSPSVAGGRVRHGGSSGHLAAAWGPPPPQDGPPPGPTQSAGSQVSACRPPPSAACSLLCQTSVRKGSPGPQAVIWGWGSGRGRGGTGPRRPGPIGALGPGWSQPVWGPGKASVSDPGLTAQRRAAQSRLPARSGPHSNTWLLPQPLGTGQAGKVRRGRSRPGEQRPGHMCRHLRLICLYSRARRCLRCRSEARGFKRASRGSLTFVYVWKRGFPPGSWSLASSSHSLMGTAVLGRGLRFLETFPSLICSWEVGSHPGL